jgi:hypothetical protein
MNELLRFLSHDVVVPLSLVAEPGDLGRIPIERTFAGIAHIHHAHVPTVDLQNT